jgi:hypothetical protein
LGTLAAGSVEYFDDRLYGDEGLKQLLPASMIAQIPALHTYEEKRRQRRRLWLIWAMTSFIFAGILVGSAISFLKG